jgi:hypothetical protein
MLIHRSTPSMTSRVSRRAGWRTARRASLAATVLAALAAPAAAARAQGAAVGLEFRPFVGAYVPTGEQRDLLEDAVLLGAQASWRVRPALAITGTFGWVPSRDRITPGDQTLDIYQYDVGAELRAVSWLAGGAWDLTPFVGLGAGGRTYDYRELDVDAATNLAGYGAIGGDVGVGAVALRLEVRDYVSRFRPLTGGGDSRTRNDIGLAVGMSYRFW